MKLEEPSTSTWWNENRNTLKLLPSWELFTAHFKDRFVPSGWRLDALVKFYTITQNNLAFQDFVTQLQAARNALASAGVGFTISDSILKNHLLMFSHPILQLRVRALPSLAFESIKVDALINVMSTTWASLVAEGRMKTSSGNATPEVAKQPGILAVPTSHSDYPLPDLSYAEHEKLCTVGGCYHCRLKPGDLDWKKHQSRNCPGDLKHSIPPRHNRSVPGPTHMVASVLPQTHALAHAPISNNTETVAVVMPRALRWSDFDDSDEYIDTDDDDH